MPSVDRAIGRALRRLRETGDRLTGGGLRSLARRALTTLVQRSMHNRRLMALGRAVLKAIPKGRDDALPARNKTGCCRRCHRSPLQPDRFLPTMLPP